MKKLTIKDIAKLANTSKTTVSFFINGKFGSMSDETKNRIAAVIEEYKFTPNAVARNLNLQKTNLIGVVVGDITNSFSNQLVKGIEEKVHELGYQIVIGSSNYNKENEEQFIEKMIQIGVDGFIVQPTTQFGNLYKKIQENKKELVFIDSNVVNDEIASVKTDNYTSVLNCMNKIIEGNYYEEYVIIGGAPQTLSTRIERTNGFLDAVNNHNKSFKNVVVTNNAKEKEVETKLLSEIDFNKRSLIFVPNCWLLPTVSKVLSQYRELIPSKLGVLGFDNTEWTNFVSPTITTIVQPAFEEGELVAQQVINQIENKSEIQNQVLLCGVNWQESIILKK